MHKIIFTTLFTLFTLTGIQAQHFIQDAKYRQQVQQDFLKRTEIFNERTQPLMDIFEEENLTTEESEALKFLYAYMPLSDLADYNGEFFLKQVRLSLSARNEFAWGKTIPEEIFRHFVLVLQHHPHPDAGPRHLLDAVRALRGRSLRDGPGHHREAPQGRQGPRLLGQRLALTALPA